MSREVDGRSVTVAVPSGFLCGHPACVRVEQAVASRGSCSGFFCAAEEEAGG
jgi:hypothetical protein